VSKIRLTLEFEYDAEEGFLFSPEELPDAAAIISIEVIGADEEMTIEPSHKTDIDQAEVLAKLKLYEEAVKRIDEAHRELMPQPDEQSKIEYGGLLAETWAAGFNVAAWQDSYAVASDLHESGKTVHQHLVEAFMKKAGQELPAAPTMPSDEIRELRATLILEEAMETIEALGFGIATVPVPGVPTEDVTGRLKVWCNGQPDMVEIVDGCCDLAVVATGTLSACGVANMEPQMLVDDSNLRKFGPGGYKAENGKWIKPPNWTPPDLAGALIRQQEKVKKEAKQ
jgi:predicted HAD superfamily Cof-like phosphohydrolase